MSRSDKFAANRIAGVDEAGRGPLAGPVVAAAVILPSGKSIQGLTDSKKVTEKRRKELELQIKKTAISWSLGCASVEEIDRLNILWASMLAMKRAIGGLSVAPDLIQVDGNRCPAIELPCEPCVGGDATIAAISAASILAKVERDRIMVKLHERFPVYGFDRHKGYPTSMHKEALTRYGATIHHRAGFGPVAAVIRQREEVMV